MKSKSILKMAAMAVVLSTGFTSCSSDDDSNTSTVSGSQAALNQACSDWKVARANWENTEAFLFGAADQDSQLWYLRLSRTGVCALPSGTATSDRPDHQS